MIKYIAYINDNLVSENKYLDLVIVTDSINKMYRGGRKTFVPSVG